MNRDRAIEIVAELFAAALFVLSLLGAYVAFRDGDFGGFVTSAFAVYLTGLLLGGTLLEVTRTRGWQIAFFAGVAVWGGYEYATGGGVFSLLLAAMGVVMVAARLLDIR